MTLADHRTLALAHRLRAWMEAEGLTTRSAAARVGVSHVTVHELSLIHISEPTRRS